MATKLEMLAEAERRGILPPEKKPLLDEAKRRGLIETGVVREPPIFQPGPGVPTEPSPELELFAGTFPEVQEERPAPSIGESIATFGRVAGAPFTAIPETAAGVTHPGAFVGGTLGAIAGGPSPVAIPLAGVGAAGGEAVEQLVRRGLGFPAAPETSTEAAERIAKEGALGIAYELGGRGVVFGAGKILQGFSKTVTPEARKAIAFLKSKGLKQPLLPAEATENRALDLLNNVAEGSLFGGGRIKRFKFERNKLLGEIAEDIADTFGKSTDPDILGDAIVDMVEGRIKAPKLLAKPIYNQVDELMQGQSVSTVALKKKAAELFKNLQFLKGQKASLVGADTVKEILTLPDVLPFDAARAYRTGLLSEVEKLTADVVTKKAPAVRINKQFLNLFNDAIETSLKSVDSEALALYKEANDLWFKGSNIAKNKFVKTLLKTAQQNPEFVAGKIFRPGAVSNIRRIKALAGDDVFRQLQGFHLQDAFLKSTKRETGELIGKTLEANIFGRQGIGQKGAQVLYGKQLPLIKDFANALKVAQAKQGEGTGRMLIQLSQAGALVSVPIKGTLSKEAATILLAPPALAQIFTRPASANFLINGIKLGPNANITATTLSRWLGDLARQMDADEVEVKDNVRVINSPL